MACGQCGIRRLKAFEGRNVKILNTLNARHLCLVGKEGHVDSADDQRKILLVSFGESGPFELTIGDVEIL